MCRPAQNLEQVSLTQQEPLEHPRITHLRAAARGASKEGVNASLISAP